MPIIAQRWPTTLLPESCRFGRSRNADLQLSPRTRRENVIVRGRPLWGASLSWSLLPPQLPELQYWLDGLDGYAGSVLLWDFSFVRAAGITYSDSCVLSATAALGAASLQVSGLVPNAPVLRGGYLQIGRRMYINSVTVVASAGGNATLTLGTPLLAATVSGTTVTLKDAACEMRLATQDWSKQFQAGAGFHTVSAEFIETVVDYA